MNPYEKRAYMPDSAAKLAEKRQYNFFFEKGKFLFV